MKRVQSSMRLPWQAGVTLIELAVTIAIVGILAALMVQFAYPVFSYIDTSRRAALADSADTALRRIGRDVRLALPNSTRVTTTGAGASTIYYLELMLVRTGGRYRADTNPAATNTCTGGAVKDVLSIGSPDDCFKTIGNISNLASVTANDFVVVFNLPALTPLTATPNANVYEFPATGGNKSQISLPPLSAFAGEDRITMTSNSFTYESPGNRFFIVEGAVSYICDPVAHTLTRRSGYAIAATQPTSAFTGGNSALLASGVTACSITYNTSVSAQGAGLVTMDLGLSATDSRGASETVNLYHAIHVNNVP
jgi:MSHA biogenesis protein MshO